MVLRLAPGSSTKSKPRMVLKYGQVLRYKREEPYGAKFGTGILWKN